MTSEDNERRNRGYKLSRDAFMFAAMKIILGLVMLIAFFKWMSASSDERHQKQLKPLLYKCLDLYPSDADVCVRIALAQKYSFYDVERTVKQYVTEHSADAK